jgi:hypothetical protein
MCGAGTATIPEHPSSPPVLSVVRVALIVDFCVNSLLVSEIKNLIPPLYFYTTPY